MVCYMPLKKEKISSVCNSILWGAFSTDRGSFQFNKKVNICLKGNGFYSNPLKYLVSITRLSIQFSE